jgi:hypothetical protein
VLSQLTCAACLLVGTIGLVLVQQNRAGDIGYVVLWLALAMTGLVFGGLVYRGGLVRMVVAAAIDSGFGIALIVFDGETLRTLLKILPPSDIEPIAAALPVAGYAMIGVAMLCLVALPQGIRYARWFRGAAATRNAMSTARGFPPPPVPARGSVYIIPAEDRPASRRGLYLVLGGLAIGVGTGVGVLVSSTEEPAPSPPSAGVVHSSALARPAVPATSTDRAVVIEPGAARAEGAVAAAGNAARPAERAVERPGPNPEPSPEPPSSDGIATTTTPRDTVPRLIAAERAAIAAVDRKALADLVIPTAFGFGLDASEVAEGRDAVVAQLARDLGAPPAGGFAVESKTLAVGQDRNHAWIAQELEIRAPGHAPRRLAITELAVAVDGTWRIVALHWATPIDDTAAERLATAGALPAPRAIVDHRVAPSELDRAVRVAFMNRLLFARAISDRPDAFNLGSGGERARGGAAIKRVFGKLKAQIHVHDGMRIVDGSAWDPAQRTDPWIGWAAQNVEYTAASRRAPAAAPESAGSQAATIDDAGQSLPTGSTSAAQSQEVAAPAEITQTFRVLAIMIKDGSGWKIVQTQWSNGGPFR